MPQYVVMDNYIGYMPNCTLCVLSTVFVIQCNLIIGILRTHGYSKLYLITMYLELASDFSNTAYHTSSYLPTLYMRPSSE